MKYDEIIKALNRMSEEDAEGFSSDVLNLVEKQQKEIEELANKNIGLQYDLQLAKEELMTIIESQTTEIEQWKEEANKYQKFWCEDVQSARAEAIKEFAERLVEYIEYRYNENCDFIPYVRLSEIEKVVYEMVGADNEH